MNTEKTISLETLNVSDLPELLGFEQKQKDLVAENPYVEITDNKTYEIACKSRTALLKGRTELEKQDKLIASKLTSFRKEVGLKTKELIDITLPSEEKQQAEVKRFEGIKQAEKELADRLEQERVERIQNTISKIENDCLEIIQKMTFETILPSSSEIALSLECDLDFEEYDLLFDQVKDRVSKSLMSKTNDITERERQRKENEAMKQEIFQVRVNRLKEVGFNLSDGVFSSIETSNKFSEIDVLNCNASLFEDVLLSAKTSIERVKQEKLDAELLEQKNQQFEIRKNRLAEIGVVSIGSKMFANSNNDVGMNEILIFEASILEFEKILVDAKESISIGNEQRELSEKQRLESEELELKNKEEAKKKADAEKKKADAENKARVKRLAKDKAIYNKILNEQLSKFPIVFDSDQDEIKEFSIEASNEVQNMLNYLLTKLNEL